MCSQRQHLSLCVLLSVLSLWLDLTSGMMNIQLIPQYPVIRESVTLSVTGITGRIHTFIWYKGPNPDAKYQILTYIIGVSSPQINGPLYFSRARPLPPSSLLISDLHLTDSDNYTVKVQTDTSSVDASVTLTVYEFSPGLDAGTIIGILVAVLLSVALVSMLIYLLIIRKRQNKPSNNVNSVTEVPSRNGEANTSTMERPELQYAAIEFNKNIPRKKQQPPGSLGEDGSPPRQPPPENVVYSELRLQTSAS